LHQAVVECLIGCDSGARASLPVTEGDGYHEVKDDPLPVGASYRITLKNGGESGYDLPQRTRLIVDVPYLVKEYVFMLHRAEGRGGGWE
jgi:hypothetical protein